MRNDAHAEIAPFLERAKATASAMDAGELFRDLHEHWVAQGGFERGKPRHSARRIKEWLGREREVRSLETKLAGKTKVTRADAKHLIELFLERWRYDERRKRHHPIEAAERGRYTDQLLAALFPNGADGLALPARQRIVTTTHRQSASAPEAPPESVRGPDLTQLSGPILRELFKEADAIVTASPARSLIGPNPHTTMAGFKQLIDDLWEIEKVEPRGRLLIWTAEIGRREYDEGSLESLYNLIFLRAQFEMLAIVDDPDRTARWQWLSEHCVVLTAGLHPGEIDACYSSADPPLPAARSNWPLITSEHVLMATLPERWVTLPSLRALYGEDLGHWSRRTFTVHPKLAGWPATSDLPSATDLRYFAHGQPPRPYHGDEANRARCIELPQPGERTVYAIRLSYAAARFRLQRHAAPTLGFDPLDAFAHLRYQGVAVLLVQELIDDLGRILRTPSTFSVGQ